MSWNDEVHVTLLNPSDPPTVVWSALITEDQIRAHIAAVEAEYQAAAERRDKLESEYKTALETTQRLGAERTHWSKLLEGLEWSNATRQPKTYTPEAQHTLLLKAGFWFQPESRMYLCPFGDVPSDWLPLDEAWTLAITLGKIRDNGTIVT